MKNKLIILISLLLGASMLLSACGGASGDKDPAGSSENGTSAEKGEGIPEDATVKVWMSPSFTKIHQTQRAPSKTPKSCSVNMARNESESCQVTVRSTHSVSGLKLVMTEGNAEGVSVELLEEHYVKTGSTYYPDPITPTDGVFDVEQNRNKSILIRFRTEKAAKAGDYIYKFELKDGSGATVETLTVSLTVWDITLPDGPACPTAGHLNLEVISNVEKLPLVKAKKYYVQYYEMLLDYGFSAHLLPYDILSDKADAYMSDPRVTGFRIDHNLSDEKLLEIYEKLKTDPVWLEKAYFYVYDEPTTVEAMQVLKDRVERVNALCPEVKTLVAFFTNLNCGGKDQVELLGEQIDILCGKSAAWDRGWLKDPLSKGYFGDRMNGYRAEGKQIWWYVCWEPGAPYCNLFVDEEGINHRALFWQQYGNDVDGFLYWMVNNWTTTEEPWKESHYSDPPGWGRVYGDGVLMYPGIGFGIEGPVASIRLECVRDGLEDFTLLKYAEELIGEAAVKNIVKGIAPSVKENTSEEETFFAVRAELAEAMLKAK